MMENVFTHAQMENILIKVIIHAQIAMKHAKHVIQNINVIHVQMINFYFTINVKHFVQMDFSKALLVKAVNNAQLFV